ncbi:16S rRNA (guanine(966)-N(2))-methyltransferase RsmD [Candidatus Blochmannia ocreatus (nom. nud.)]|uniref:Ribosomal RNA small subunit methyltransferase D n=1 Tax=Candidatus Blochmannia ocreatus (nom. nud.) TaxID=251538 RepID=A0ABY4SSY9_9ENTR|nr:16S rRNA (guanine(966)-N(2))-methyltransferase RsmD [Candidatus Blochmannia ocreatus]URJ25094.1 16S rRNA (guanine(966)-N(2))-methyltransferase RsmD [Candidatus Blochmannia ocreatus]
MFGTIRITGGKWKGRKVFVGKDSQVRPTTNRIREMLFDWLNPIIFKSLCLDCFAGSGALGLESLSRGANKVTFLDIDYTCIKRLLEVTRLFLVLNSNVICIDCCTWLKKSTEIYNVVFIDPPFQNNDLITKVINLLEKYNRLSTESWIYVENLRYKYTQHTYIVPANWDLYKKKDTKRITCSLFCRTS